MPAVPIRSQLPVRCAGPAPLLAALLLACAPSVVWAQDDAPTAEEEAPDLRSHVEQGLAHADPQVQGLAVRAAMLLQDAAMTAQVESHLDNGTPSVRMHAASALLQARPGHPGARAALVALVAEGDAAQRAATLDRVLPLLAHADQRAILDAALAGMEDGSPVQQVLSWLAQRAQGPVYDLLVEQAGTASDARLRQLLAAVELSGREEGLAVAQRLISDSRPERRTQGAELAFRQGGLQAQALLEPLLGGSDEALAQRVGFVLAGQGNQDALQWCRALAFNPDMPVELRVEAMAMVRDRAPQMGTLADLRSIAEDTAAAPALRRAAWEWIGATRDPQGFALLMSNFEGLFSDLRLYGIAGVGFAGEAAPVDALVAILQGGGELNLREASASALGRAGTPQAVAALTNQLFTEREESVRLAILDGLATTGSSEAAMAIANEFSSSSTPVALAALEAVRRLGNTAVIRQVESLTSSSRDAQVRWRAILTLVQLDPELGRVRLLQALNRPPAGFREDLEGMPPELLRAVDERLVVHSDDEIRATALARVLSRSDGGYAVLRPLLEGNLTADVRAQAIQAVVQRRDPADAPLLQTLAQDTDRNTRLTALVALAELGLVESQPFFSQYVGHADPVLRLLGAWAMLKLEQAG
jgi:HEAT repeat protein